MLISSIFDLFDAKKMIREMGVIRFLETEND